MENDMNKSLLTAFTICCLFPAHEAFAQTSPVADGAKLEKIAGSYTFTEGPCADRDGNVFFTDQPSDRILKWSLDGKVTTFLHPSGRSNGMNFTADGTLISCADDKTELWSIDQKGKSAVLAASYKGKPLNGPNDVYVTAEGGMYLTDPFYLRPWWKHTTMPQDCQAVYFLPPGETELVRVADDLDKPNGIIGTADGKTLYVADIGANKTWKYSILSGGQLAGKKLFCNLGSDGMTIDAEGNLYLTGKGVTVFDPTGKKIVNIGVPENWTANVCFGGADRKTLFITASRSVYRLRMNIPGMHNPGK
jgi:gluconolactonase